MITRQERSFTHLRKFTHLQSLLRMSSRELPPPVQQTYSSDNGQHTFSSDPKHYQYSRKTPDVPLSHYNQPAHPHFSTVFETHRYQGEFRQGHSEVSFQPLNYSCFAGEEPWGSNGNSIPADVSGVNPVWGDQYGHMEVYASQAGYAGLTQQYPMTNQTYETDPNYEYGTDFSAPWGDRPPVGSFNILGIEADQNCFDPRAGRSTEYDMLWEHGQSGHGLHGRLPYQDFQAIPNSHRGERSCPLYNLKPTRLNKMVLNEDKRLAEADAYGEQGVFGSVPSMAGGEEGPSGSIVINRENEGATALGECGVQSEAYEGDYFEGHGAEYENFNEGSWRTVGGAYEFGMRGDDSRLHTGNVHHGICQGVEPVETDTAALTAWTSGLSIRPAYGGQWDTA